MKKLSFLLLIGLSLGKTAVCAYPVEEEDVIRQEKHMSPVEKCMAYVANYYMYEKAGRADFEGDDKQTQLRKRKHLNSLAINMFDVCVTEGGKSLTGRQLELEPVEKWSYSEESSEESLDRGKVVGNIYDPETVEVLQKRMGVDPNETINEVFKKAPEKPELKRETQECISSMIESLGIVQVNGLWSKRLVSIASPSQVLACIASCLEKHDDYVK